MKDLTDIANEINSNASLYRMGRFQDLRKKIHGKGPKTKKVFTKATIHENWAFHLGGRTELQYNIGFENEDHSWFRYGVAFSLKRTQALQDVSVLYPKIMLWNEYIEKNQKVFSDLYFWYACPTKRSPKLPVQPAPENLFQPKTFLFWGKLIHRELIDVDKVLILFDRLLDGYEYVEGNIPLPPAPDDPPKRIKFKPGCPPPKPIEEIVVYSKRGVFKVSLRHNSLQDKLYKSLSSQYGEPNVGYENDTGRGSRIDVVVYSNQRYQYYEIKTHPCIRTCLREGISQLLEYSLWPGGNKADKLVVVSENAITPDAKIYLELLRKEHSLPLFYQQINIDTGELSDFE